jgi:2-polyprenyl-6-methoxyphenol hydroxylase-like FAD-dependent oxidoreductase
VSDSPVAVFRRLNRLDPPGQAPVRLDRALVLGGSIAGLLAARVLADHASSVVIIDSGRSGVPQSPQVHTLLPGGRAQLERWFPGLTREARDEGAFLNGPDECAIYADQLRRIRTENSVLLTSSRPFLEAHIRRRTLALPNVAVVTGQVTGLGYDRGAVTAVRYEGAGGEIVADTDFVVDAMGRASRLSDWLERDGWERPRLERMGVGVNYATASFRRSADRPAIGAAIVRCTPRFPDQTMAFAAANAIENGLWMVLLAGYGEDRPGRTREDFLARCAALPSVFADAASGELVGQIRTYRHADSRRRHFARARRLPARLVSVGDAVASFNPVFGQGMSSAALQVSCLAEYLGAGPDFAVPAHEFFALQQVVVDAAWQISTSADAARLASRRQPRLGMRLWRWLRLQVLMAGMIDEQLATRLTAVTNMTEHPRSLVTPDTALRAIAANRRARSRPA